jgi:hypothetical protein
MRVVLARKSFPSEGSIMAGTLSHLVGAMLAFVFWLYVVSAIILIGGELNSSLYQYLDDKRSESSPQPQLTIPILRPAVEQRRT